MNVLIGAEYPRWFQRIRPSSVFQTEATVPQVIDLSNTYDADDERLALPLAQQFSRLAATDSDLARVIGAWADLPEAIRKAILTLVDTSR